MKKTRTGDYTIKIILLKYGLTLIVVQRETARKVGQFGGTRVDTQVGLGRVLCCAT